ncbi:MBL fold metallo-hydrolase [Cohnella sp. 56]|uniref:MBL fold metallo-hydrolase n=1 Tax=Cohnella sp. 56 TaxID=3113722 RepID=UPI0030EA1067
MLELNLGPATLSPVILIEDDAWTLIDTGMPGSAPALLELAKQAGIGDRPLRAILLTHQDIDHIGGLPGILSASEAAPLVYAHPDDEGAINGTAPMIKMTPERLSGFLQQVPESVRLQFEETFLRPSRPNVNRTFADGELLPIGGGLTVIHTPGHTPGHVSLYHHASKTLILGDASVARDGELKGPNPPVTPDMELALESLKKLSEIDIAQAVCYHGGLVREGVQAQLARLSERS